MNIQPVFLALVIFAALVSGAPSAVANSTQGAGNVIDQWVIVLPDPRNERRKGRATGPGYTGRLNYADDPVLDRIARRIVRDYGLDLVEQWPIEGLQVHCLIVRLPDARARDEMLERLRRDERIESVQRLNTFSTLGQTGTDPYRNMQAALDRINLSGLHRYVTGEGVSVALIDSAVDKTHPELSAALRVQEDMVENAEHPMRGERHGTGIAGVIAATANNGQGISGIAPDIKLLSYRACWQLAGDASGSRCNTLTLSRALDRVLARRPDVVNLSLSGPADPLLERLLAQLVARGVIVVTAYDEHRSAAERFPQPRSGVFFAHDDRLSNVNGAAWLVPAPAAEVLAPQPRGSYDFISGNSVAAAHVSGAIALMLEAKPNMRAARIRDSFNTHIAQLEGTTVIDLCATLEQIDRTIECRG